jgi:biliverdin reductase
LLKCLIRLGVLLYEEDIALLTDRYEALKNLIQQKGKLTQAEISMTSDDIAAIHENLA